MPSRSNSSDTGVPKAFQFIEGRPATNKSSSSNGNKENVALQQSDSKTAAADEAIQTFPSTPATRIPLADLIGDIDDLHRTHDVRDESPEERIQWNTERSPRRSGQTPSRTVKRTRSSSPPASSLRDQSLHVKRLKIYDDQATSQPDTTTTRMDPTTDAWHRYTSGANGNTSGIAPAVLANVLEHSSPQAAHNHAGTVSGLRRWTSCGIGWPNSDGKKKPSPRNHKGLIDNVLAAHSETLPEQADDGQSKKVKIGVLLGRIQESLAKPRGVDSKGPSSSSPLPERGENNIQQSASPIRSVIVSVKSRQTSPALDVSQHEPANHAVPPGSSSFGSEDLDLDNFDLVVAGNISVINPEPQKSPEDVFMESTQLPESPAQQVVLEEGDFDDDDELSLGDLEGIASKYDEKDDRSMSYGTPVEIASLASNAPMPDLEEDFEDADIDEASFAAAEAAATQTNIFEDTEFAVSNDGQSSSSTS